MEPGTILTLESLNVFKFLHSNWLFLVLLQCCLYSFNCLPKLLLGEGLFIFLGLLITFCFWIFPYYCPGDGVYWLDSWGLCWLVDECGLFIFLGLLIIFCWLQPFYSSGEWLVQAERTIILFSCWIVWYGLDSYVRRFQPK